jgi:hypothetical protein
VAAVVAACGSRTGLIVPLDEQGDADALPDVHHRDAGADVREGVDALPPIDVTPPRDVLNVCPDAAATLIYVISEANVLMSFYPTTGVFTPISTISCPGANGSNPFSMAVNRSGIAYIVFNPSGQLFRVSTATGACQPTSFVTGQQGFSSTFGMGFSKDLIGTGETLYVASDESGPVPSRLATIDTTTFQLDVVGSFNPPINRAELTGTGAGDLFGFYAVSAGSAIGQIDKTTAQVVGQSDLTSVNQGSGWAFGFWGGDFYTFTAPGAGTVVTRFRPSDGSIVQVASTSEIIVGAGVSTCAPQQ